MAGRRSSPGTPPPGAALLATVLVFSATVGPAQGLRMPAALGPLLAPLRDALDGGHRKCIPTQVHLAVTGRAGEMRVMWKTRSASCPTTVHYGESAANVPARLFHTLQQRQGSMKTYSAADMCASPARDYKYDPNFLHDVVLSGLVPGRRYSYKVVHSPSIMAFQAPPTAGRKEGFQFLAYGDVGDPHHRQAKAPGAAGTVKYTRRDVEAGADLVFHVGDVSYADGREYVWNSFMTAIEPAASRVPYMVAVGNHEYDYSSKASRSKDPSGSDPYNPGWANWGNDSGGECGVSIASRFSMPGSDLMAFPRDANATVAGRSSGPFSDSGGRASGSGGGGGRASAAPRGLAAGGEAPGGRSEALPAAPQLPLRRTVRDAQAGGAAGPQGQQLQNPQPAVAGAPQGLGKKLRRANPPFWYSFDYGAVHFVAVSSEHDLHKHSQQYKWLKRDLQRVDRCVTPWVVLAMHRPMYVVFPHKSNRVFAEHLRRQLESLLNKHEVDLVLSGHVHSYARTCNVLGGKCTDMAQGGMTHITLGCGGHKLSDVNHDQPEWLAATYVGFGYGRITVHDGYELTFEFVRTSDGEVHDSYRLRNTRADRRTCFQGAAPNATIVGASVAAV